MGQILITRFFLKIWVPDTYHLVTSQFIFPICHEMVVVVIGDDILVCISVFLYTQANVHFISILHVKMLNRNGRLAQGCHQSVQKLTLKGDGYNGQAVSK